MTDLVPISELLDVETGEILPATVTNAGRVIIAARNMKSRINEVVAAATAYLADESAVQGTKTLHGDGLDISLNGGKTLEYDADDLMTLLRDAKCPEERIAEAVVTEITYKVNRSVLKQLAAANEDYALAIELCSREVDKPMRASVKEGLTR